MALKQTLNLKQQQKLSPLQIQLMKLLQIPVVALEQRVKEEMEVNPALDEGREDEEEEEQEDDFGRDEISEAEQEFDFSNYTDDETPSYKLNTNNHSKDDKVKEAPLRVGSTFREQMMGQLMMLSLDEQEFDIAEYLIGSLDDSGYLRRSTDAVVDDLAFTKNIIVVEEDVQRMLKVIQHFEPIGVGAKDLRECLLLQLRTKKKTLAVKTAMAILTDHYKLFVNKHYNKIHEALLTTNEDLKEALNEITKLNPKPGNSSDSSTKTTEYITPDFYLRIEDDEILVSLDRGNAPDLKISNTYKEMILGYTNSKEKPSKSQKDALMFIKQKIDSAKWFIDAIKQRQHTLSSTVEAIVDYQKEYFLTGDDTLLKPMILKNIAEIVLMDISTISRIVNSTYIQTPYGVFLLKRFFSEALTTTTGEDVSSIEVKKILQGAIEDEDKSRPLTDEKLSKILNDKGYNIARRTVAKYREKLKFPVARLRKEL